MNMETITVYTLPTPDGTIFSDKETDLNREAEERGLRKQFGQRQMTRRQYENLPEFNY